MSNLLAVCSRPAGCRGRLKRREVEEPWEVMPSALHLVCIHLSAGVGRFAVLVGAIDRVRHSSPRSLPFLSRCGSIHLDHGLDHGLHELRLSGTFSVSLKSAD